MSVVIFYPANVTLLVRTIEPGCEFCRDFHEFYVGENKTETFNAFDYLHCDNIDIEILDIEQTEDQLLE